MTKRRTRGEGGVRQRRDGRWQGAIDLGWQGGKRRRKYVTQRNGETKQSFLARFRRERAAIEAGRPAVDERIRVGDFLDRWLVEVVKRETGQSPRGVQYIHAVPRAALATAMRWELVGRNVATLVEPISVRRKEVVPVRSQGGAGSARRRKQRPTRGALYRGAGSGAPPLRSFGAQLGRPGP